MDPEDVATLLRALLVLMVEEREAREAGANEKIEVLLARAGMQPAGIASLLGKNLDAVRKTLQRAGAKASG